MASVVFFAVFCLVAYKSNPDDQSFKEFLTKATENNQNQSSGGGSSSSGGGFFSRLFKRHAEVGSFERKDYALFSIANVKRQSYFLGMFNMWFNLDGVIEFGQTMYIQLQDYMERNGGQRQGLLPTSSGRNSISGEALNAPGSASAISNLDEASETFYQQALEYKRKRSMSSAASSFLRAARCSEPFNAGTMYEEAYKCFQYEKDWENSLKSLESAYSCFQEIARFGRCAKISETMAEVCIKKGDINNAISKLAQASENYDREGDKRSIICKSQMIDFMIKVKRYKEARELFEKHVELLKDDSLLQFQVPSKLFNLHLSYIPSQDWPGLSASLQRYQDKIPSFAASREYQFLTQLSQAALNFDPDAYDKLLESYIQVSGSTLDNWKIKILRDGKTGLAKNDLT